MTDTTTHNNKRLAKNTLLLYVRTILILFINLFTSRIILNTLGVKDYGIYNVVGGFVAMFGIVSQTLTSTTQRFLNFELGKKQGARSQIIFSASMSIHIGLSILLIILFETIGIWFLNCKMNIEPHRMIASNWVFQCSIITFILNILSQPYNATIIAHERISAFAYISLLDVLLKLLLVYMLYLSPWDNLIVYSILLMIEATFIRFIYSNYSRRNFSETKFIFVKDKTIYKEITGFAGLNFLGVLASILSSQGVNILLNLFFGVVLNAARGIATQVNNAILKFVDDFMTAFRPQITKCCAAERYQEMKNLCYKGTRFSYYLILLFSIPIIYKTPLILDFWLKTYPIEAVAFVRLTLVLSLFTVLSKTTISAITATGKIKGVTFSIGLVHLFTLPLCYMILKFGYPAESVYVVIIFVEIVLLIIRLVVLRHLLGFKLMEYVHNVILVIIMVTIPIVVMNHCISAIFKDTFFNLMLYLITSISFSIFTIYLLGMKKKERDILVGFIKRKINKKNEIG